LLWLPASHDKSSPIPFIVNYHGGPEGQSRPVFSAANQFLLSEGFGILQPNVRGSTGYGRAFLMMDDYKKRWDSVKDGVFAAEWLVENGHAQPGRIATYGGSYGGFMSIACLVEDQSRVDAKARSTRLFGAGVDIVGIVNLQTFLEKTSGYRRKLREVEYGPLTDPEFLQSVSSINQVEKINVPVFIAHGFNDPRVPVEEAMQLATRLKDQAFARKDMTLMPRLFVAPDEGHGFAKLDNRLYFTQRVSEFLKSTIGRPPQDFNK
jgi:dipeptidyl aminopeptidase/acylaminoacyl peptidase